MSCPVNGSEHRYFLHGQGAKIEYVPIDRALKRDIETSLPGTSEGLYQRVETALLGCACGDVIKKAVTDATA